MSKAASHILAFSITFLVLFGLLALPGLASEPQAPLLPGKHVVPPLEASSRFSSQMTFTPVATIYLPIVLSSPPATPNCNFFEPNDTPGQANLIQNGETQTHCIVPATDIDWLKFLISDKSQVVVKASDVGGKLELRLYDSQLNELDFSYSWPDRPALIDRNCGRWAFNGPLESGTYYLTLEHWLNSGEIDNYNVSLNATPCPVPVVLPNYSYYTPFFNNDLIVVGEIQNVGQLSIASTEVIGNLFNGGQLIDTATNFIRPDVIPPNETTCFAIGFNETSGWTDFQFETPTYGSAGDAVLENMSVISDTGTYNPADGSYRVLGFVRNDNTFTVNSAEPVITLYNNSDTVVGCRSTLVNSTNLNPGQESSFELEFSGFYRDYVDVSSYRIQVDGYPQ